MTKIENICVVAMEECAEIQQTIAKALRFGFNKSNPYNCDTFNPNSLDIWTEYLQLQAVMEMLEDTNEIGHLDEETKKDIKENKKKKVLDYLEVSKLIGTVK